MVKKISDNYQLPYFTISPTFSICPVHGYLSGEHEYCPKCDADIAEAEKLAEEHKEEIVVGDNVGIVEPKVEREILVPMKSKLNIGSDGDGEDKV